MAARLRKELVECEKDSELTGVSVQALGRDLKTLEGTILGPPDSPYEGGTFKIYIKIPSSYPFEPPKMKFETKVWHPNVSSQTGAICLDILKDNWSPALTLKTALLSVQALLTAAEPDDPQDAQVAKMYKSNYKEFVRTAKHWTATYASNKKPTYPEEVKQLVAMGIDAKTAGAALQKFSGSVERALEGIFG